MLRDKYTKELIKKFLRQNILKAPYIKRRGFTLAEMMVVLLIMSIILAAFAPVMTTRSKMGASNENIWKYAANRSDTYFGDGAAKQRVMIGQDKNESSKARLLINASDDTVPFHISFFNGGASSPKHLANLSVYNNSLVFNSSNSTLSSNYNTILGINANGPATGGSNVAVGYSAMQNVDAAVNNSVAVGYSAMKSSGMKDSVAIGYNAGNYATGDYSIAIGADALSGTMMASSSGEKNTAVGTFVLKANTSGAYNTAVGSNALLTNSTGGSNVAVGVSSLYKNTTGSENVAIGYQSLNALTTGSSNIGIGYNACNNVTTGSNKVCIGKYSNPADTAWYTDNVERIFIGGGADSNPILSIHNDTSKADGKGVVIDGDLLVTGDIYHKYGGAILKIDEYNSVEGGSGVVPFLTEQSKNSMLPSVSSDRRLKNVGEEFKAGLDKIKQLKLYNFTYKKDENKTPHVGVMAQDLQEIFPDAVKKGQDGFLSIRMEDMFYALVNAVKELDEKITNLINEVKILQEQNKEIIKQNKQLEQRLEALEKKL